MENKHIKNLEEKAADLKKPASELNQLIDATEDSFIELIGFCRGNVGGKYLRNQFDLVTQLFDELKEETKDRRMPNKPYCPKCGDSVKNHDGICQNCV